MHPVMQSPPPNSHHHTIVIIMGAPRPLQPYTPSLCHVVHPSPPLHPSIPPHTHTLRPPILFADRLIRSSRGSPAAQSPLNSRPSAQPAQRMSGGLGGARAGGGASAAGGSGAATLSVSELRAVLEREGPQDR